MKYWSTVRKFKLGDPLNKIGWRHTIRYGNKAIAQYIVSERSPFGAYSYIHQGGDQTVQILMEVQADKNQLYIKEIL